MSRALETVLRKFPVEASTMLADGGVLKQVGIPPGTVYLAGVVSRKHTSSLGLVTKREG